MLINISILDGRRSGNSHVIFVKNPPRKKKKTNLLSLIYLCLNPAPFVAFLFYFANNIEGSVIKI